MKLLKGTTLDMSKSKSVSTKQQRIAELAKNAPNMAMDLSHHLDVEWFVEAFRRTRKDGAAIPLDETDKRLMNLLQSSFTAFCPLERILGRAGLFGCAPGGR